MLALDASNLLALKNLANIVIQDNPDEAVSLAQQAVEIASEDPSAQDSLGWALYRKGNYGLAAEHLKTAFAKEPTPRRQFRLGMSYLKAGDRDLGLQMRATALEPGPNASNGKGTVRDCTICGYVGMDADEYRKMDRRFRAGFRRAASRGPAQDPRHHCGATFRMVLKPRLLSHESIRSHTIWNRSTEGV